MKKIIFLSMVMSLSGAFSQASQLNCSDRISGNFFVANINSDKTVSYTDQKNEIDYTATTNIFGSSQRLPLWVASNQADRDGKALIQALCKVDLSQSQNIEVAVVSSTRFAAEACLSCVPFEFAPGKR